MISSPNIIEIYEFIFITFIVKTIHSFERYVREENESDRGGIGKAW